MGLFTGVRAVLTANDVLKRIESCFEMLNYNLDSGNLAQARTYCNDIAARAREFVEILEKSKTAEVSVYKFNGRKYKSLPLIIMITDVIDHTDKALKSLGY